MGREKKRENRSRHGKVANDRSNLKSRNLVKMHSLCNVVHSSRNSFVANLCLKRMHAG